MTVTPRFVKGGDISYRSVGLLGVHLQGERMKNGWGRARVSQGLLKGDIVEQNGVLE